MHKLRVCASCSLKDGDQMTGNDVPFRVPSIIQNRVQSRFHNADVNLRNVTAPKTHTLRFLFFPPFSQALKWKACLMLHVLGCNYKRRKLQRVNNNRVKLVYGSEGRSRCVVYKRNRACSKSCTCNKREFDGNRV